MLAIFAAKWVAALIYFTFLLFFGKSLENRTEVNVKKFRRQIGKGTLKVRSLPIELVRLIPWFPITTDIEGYRRFKSIFYALS